ncbi:flagellar basal-body MS-ring/collar protein FliF [Benzoatithermus flavus]|uniref:Flagellar M-ring protein n=1 Tax=Benzoatithermus flavus TaxID=3108223 RepID=A0ABU8XX44_9PROT
MNFEKLTRPRLAALGAVGVALMGLFAWLMLAQPETSNRVLFGGVAPGDVAAMTQILDGAGIPYRLSSDGGSIMVPEQDLGRARMLVAGQGLPSQGSTGYELLDKAQTLGSTQFRDEVTYLRALEGELARTIASLSGVRAAKVHIVMAKREPFSRDWTPPSASVLLTVISPDLVGRQQVAAIRHLVASAVPRLRIENVSIVDNYGNLLASADSGEGADLDRNDQRRIALEDRIARALEEQLTPIVGAGRVRAKVSAELDLSSERSVQESYDPMGQVPRSQQTETERERSTDTKQNVSVEKDLPENAGKPPSGGARQTEQDRSKQTINYEIGKTTREFVAGSGRIKRLSISIAVDGVCEVDAQGRTSCRPRTTEELALLERLARATAGFSAERGDTFEIASMPFSALEPNIVSEAPPAPPPTLLDVLRAHLVLTVLGVVTVLLLLGTLLLALLRARRRRAEAEARALAAEAEAKAALEAAEARALEAAEAAKQLPQPEDQPLLAVSSEAGEGVVDLGGNVQGGVRRATIQQVQQIIDTNLDEAVAFLKIWLHDKAKAR